MDHPELVTHDDRTISIGVLANLSSGFLVSDPSTEASTLNHMMNRYRSDLGKRIGHTPSDDECHSALEEQIQRLRRSIGEDV
ncbi:hypothetical protein C5C55_08500 [Rathayibacter sp. AY1C2]|uniref:hypothetical protein n=1 Tax=Rathayibacter sp. AY1C2 TaxID=2080535 RepID=UPI000CE89B1E|nr:hypothetical protein [Rathayibacter sp. AY1C2]PPF56540.1 hypothetical protein C5C55_08500 [Rathayibacter sp. AY1C2]